jgi:hypothetical protein
MALEKLKIYTEGLFNFFLKECFMRCLKEKIKEHVTIHDPHTWLSLRLS